MNAAPENSLSSAPADCQQVLEALLLRWPEEPSDSLPSVLLDHLCHCRSCLRKWIALEAAADLAHLPELPDDMRASDEIASADARAKSLKA